MRREYDDKIQGDAALFYEDLLKIARTTLSSKLVSADKDHFGLN